jgi:hypothetical protein
MPTEEHAIKLAKKRNKEYRQLIRAIIKASK